MTRVVSTSIHGCIWTSIRFCTRKDVHLYNRLFNLSAWDELFQPTQCSSMNLNTISPAYVRAFTFVLLRVLAKWYLQFYNYDCCPYSEFQIDKFLTFMLYNNYQVCLIWCCKNIYDQWAIKKTQLHKCSNINTNQKTTKYHWQWQNIHNECLTAKKGSALLYCMHSKCQMPTCHHLNCLQLLRN